MLDGIEVRLNVDYLEKEADWMRWRSRWSIPDPLTRISAIRLGTLEYRSVRFETELLDMPNFQGNAAVNYTDRETPWTRIIEHKWFEFGKDEAGNDLPKTVISREYSSEWKPGDEPVLSRERREKRRALCPIPRFGGAGEKRDLRRTAGRIQVLRHGYGHCGGAALRRKAAGGITLRHYPQKLYTN